MQPVLPPPGKDRISAAGILASSDSGKMVVFWISLHGLRFASNDWDMWHGEVLSPGQGEVAAARPMAELAKSELIRCS